MARKLIVEIVGDATSLERAFKKSERSAKRFQGSMETTSRKTKSNFAGIGRGLVGLGVGVGIVDVIKDSVVAASDLEQQMGKTNVVFGESGQEVEAWSKTLSTSFGLSQREALTTASSLGALFAPIGLTGKAAAEQSEKLTELGADLASFYNTDVQSALDAIRSGIVGESEPLRKYGVLLSETRVQQQAMADTGKTTAASLTDQEKVLARIKILYQDSATAQGDFGRTAGQAAQQAKIMQANIENLKAELATELIPALGTAVGLMNDLFKKRQRVRESPFAFFVEPLTDQLRSFKNTSQDLLTQLGLIRKAARAVLPPAGALGPVAAAVLPPAGARGPVGPGLTAQQLKDRRARLRRAAAAARELRQAARVRIRQAAEAARQAVQDRAEFNVEKTGATKTLKDDLAALRHYNALLTRRIRGGHGTLELEREQFRVQMQIADVLRQQAEAIKKQKAQRKRMGVDVTRFQKTARGQFVLAGAAGGGRGVVISGGVHLHGIQNVSQLENELRRRAKQRSHPRRSR